MLVRKILVRFKRISIINPYCYNCLKEFSFQAKHTSQEKEPFCCRESFWNSYIWNDTVSRICFKTIKEWWELCFASVFYLPKHSLSKRKTSDKSQLRDVLQNTWAVYLKTIDVIKTKESLRNFTEQRRLSRRDNSM